MASAKPRSRRRKDVDPDTGEITPAPVATLEETTPTPTPAPDPETAPEPPERPTTSKTCVFCSDTFQVDLQALDGARIINEPGLGISHFICAGCNDAP